MSAPSLDTIAALTSSREEREKTDRFFVEGERFVIMALTTRAVVDTVVLSRKMRISSTLEKLLAKHRGTILETTKDEFAALSTAAEPSGIGAVVRRTFGQLPARHRFRGKRATRGRQHGVDRAGGRGHSVDQVRGRGPWLGFDKVRSRGNLGAVIRTAAAFDAGGILFLSDAIDPFDPIVVRATMGAIFLLPLVRTTPSEFDHWRCKTGAYVLGTSAKAHRDLRKVLLDRLSVMMVGCERGGLSEEQRSVCHDLARIPMSGRVDSLNLAI